MLQQHFVNNNHNSEDGKGRMSSCVVKYLKESWHGMARLSRGETSVSPRIRNWRVDISLSNALHLRLDNGHKKPH